MILIRISQTSGDVSELFCALRVLFLLLATVCFFVVKLPDRTGFMVG